MSASQYSSRIYNRNLSASLTDSDKNFPIFRTESLSEDNIDSCMASTSEITEDTQYKINELANKNPVLIYDASSSCNNLGNIQVIDETTQNTSEQIRRRQSASETPIVAERRRRNRDRKKGINISKIINRMGYILGIWSIYKAIRCNKDKWNGKFIWGLLIGGFIGFKIVARYKINKKLKSINKRVLGLPLSDTGLFQICNNVMVPNIKALEHVASLNHFLMKVWPFYESAVCKWIIDFITPMLESSKPQFISKIKFSKLTFGDVPFDVTDVKVIKEGKDEFIIEAGIKWSGTAHVALNVVLKGGGAVQPQVMRLNFYATVRISFTPLVPYFPGFGAMTVCLKAPPHVDFELTVSQMLISRLNEKVRSFLHSFLVNDLLGNVLVWPSRVVIPILPEEQRGNIDNLHLRTRGVLRVFIREAEDLGLGEEHNGFNNKIHPFVILETAPSHKLKTKVLPDGQHPVWNEDHFLKVQELEQCLKVDVLDDHYDPMSPIRNSSGIQRHGRKLGHLTIPLISIFPGQEIDEWYELQGLLVDEALEPVRSKHHGQDVLSENWYIPKKTRASGRIRLSLTYMPLEYLRQGQLRIDANSGNRTSIHKGLFFLRLLKAYNLKNIDGTSTTVNSYCILSMGTEEIRRSRVVKDTLDPTWNENFEWFNVSVKESLIIEIEKIFDEGAMVDTPLGYVKIAMDVVANESLENNYLEMIEATLPIEGGQGDIQLQLDWVPLNRNPNSDKKTGHSLGKKVNLRQNDMSLKGCVKLRLLRARELTNVEFIGYSDPYCILKIQGGSRKKSKVVRDNLNPEWFEVFSWQQIKYDDTLKIDIWDKGTLQDTFLGRCVYNIEDISKIPGKVKEICQGLTRNDGSEKTAGVLIFQIVWTLEEKREIDWPEPSF